MKKYMNIKRLKPSYCDGFESGDLICIQEKIDGANFSILYDKETDSIKVFSRRNELNFEMTLHGAWEWSQKLDKKLIREVLGTDKILFAEWLIKHAVVYTQEAYNKAYCYDIYDTLNQQYLPQKEVKEIVKRLNLIYIPVFYEGPFISWEHIKGFIGQTKMGGKYGEGIVVKNQTKLNNPNTRLPFYIKLVGEEFCETKSQRHNKPIDSQKLKEREQLQALTETIVTLPRIRKLLFKLIEDNIIPENWNCYDMTTISKNIPRAVYDDCKKEEFETVNMIPDFGKYAASISMRLVKELLKERESI